MQTDGEGRPKARADSPRSWVEVLAVNGLSDIGVSLFLLGRTS